MKEIIKSFAAINHNGARSGLKRLGMVGVTIHQTGNTSRGANALNHASYLLNSGANKQASWHYCVDDTRITQSIPEDESAWHAGDGYYGKGNRQTIAIEICINEDGNMLLACENAAELAADILKRYGLGTSNLYQHHDWSGKNCPAQIRGGQPYDWSTFVSKVAIFMEKNQEAVPDAGVDQILKVGEHFIFPDVYAAEDVSIVEGIWCAKNTRIGGYIPVEYITRTDAQGNTLSDQNMRKTGDYFRIPGRFTVAGGNERVILVKEWGIYVKPEPLYEVK